MTSDKPAPQPGDHSQAASVVKDTLGGVAATALAAGAFSTDRFVTNGMSAILYELKAADIALQRSQRDDVRAFAQHMHADFGTMKNELASFLGGTIGPTAPPEQPIKLHQVLLDDLKGASDEDFDQLYVTQQKLAHLEAITLFKTFHKLGDNDGLKNLCHLGLPVLKEHAQMADRLGDALDD